MIRLALLAAAVVLIPSGTRAQDFAVTHVTAWTMTDDRPVQDATIIVRDGRIASVEPGGQVPRGMPEVPGGGAVVTPGLFNAATQLGLVEMSGAKATRDMTTTWDRVGAGFDVSYALNGNSTLIALARADGLTGALSYPGPSAKMPFAGEAAVIKLRDGADILDRAQVALVVRIGGREWEKQSGSRAAQWQSLFELFDHVRTEWAKDDDHKDGSHSDGRRGPHGRSGLESTGRGSTGRGPTGRESRGPEEADKAAIDAALDRVTPLVIFTNRESDIRQAIALTAEYQLRTVIVGGAQAWRAAKELAAANIPVVVTPSQNLPVSYDEFATRSDNAAILARAGVQVAFGQAGGVISNTFNAGIALRQEAGIAVANGMPFGAALRSVTSIPRAIYGGAAGAGTLAEGQEATFVLWDGDPLEPATLATQVFIDGKATSIETRQDLLAKRYLGQ